MSEKMFLNLLLLCGIISQGIIGTFADEDIKNSSDILKRQKRVYNYVPGENARTPIRNAPYIALIKYSNRIICVTSIMSPHVTITASACVQFAPEHYKIGSNSARTDAVTLHNVAFILKRSAGHPDRPSDGIALIAVEEPFVRGGSVDFIDLHVGPLLAGTFGIVSGWGCNTRNPAHDAGYRRNLRSIQVPILSHRDCVNRYRHHGILISDKEICTFHPQKHCGHNDGGAPLVIDGYLAGIRLWTGPYNTQDDPEYPDVFAVLQDYEYNQWIRAGINNIETHFQHNHY